MGKNYFHNKATGFAAWEMEAMDMGGNDTDQIKGGADTSFDLEALKRQPKKKIHVEQSQESEDQEQHGEWLEAVDVDSGETYYYHTISQRTVWEPPWDEPR